MTTRTFAGTTTTNDLSARLKSVTSITVLETGGTGPLQVYVRNGSGTGDAYIPIRVAAGAIVSLNFAHPIHFPLGVYFAFTSDATYTGTPRWAVTGY